MSFGLYQLVSQRTYALQRYLHHITGLEPALLIGGIPHHHARGGAGKHHIAGLEGNAFIYIVDNLPGGKDQVVGAGILPQLSVDAGLNVQLSSIKTIGGDGIGADGAEAVIALASKPLACGALPLPNGEIVSGGIG